MTAKEKIDYSVIIPVFNESASLRELTSELMSVLGGMGAYEIIFINDGSTDSSSNILDALSREFQGKVRVIHLRKNCGKSLALRYGFENACGKIAVMMDADLQDKPKEIPRLVHLLEERNLDVVNGWRVARRDSISKTFPSMIFNYFLSRLSGIRLHDFNCGLKVMRQECLKDLRLYGQLHRFMVVFLAKQGFKVGECKVEHSIRKFGSSKYGGKRIYEGMMDLLTMIFITRYLHSPLYFFGFYGLFCFLISFFYTGFFFTMHVISVFTIFPQGRLTEHPLWILGPVLFLVGIIFIFFGLMGELIYHLFSSQFSQNHVKKLMGFDNA